MVAHLHRRRLRRHVLVVVGRLAHLETEGEGGVGAMGGVGGGGGAGGADMS